MDGKIWDVSIFQDGEAASLKNRNVPFFTSLSLAEAKDQVYRKLIITALRKANWNQIKAAQLLGVSRYCLIRWLRKLQISY